MLVHDHGPAARHSLCGPFFRRARGYYRGVQRLLKAGIRGGGEAERAQSLGTFERFATMSVSLSSGCKVRAPRVLGKNHGSWRLLPPVCRAWQSCKAAVPHIPRKRATSPGRYPSRLRTPCMLQARAA